MSASVPKELILINPRLSNLLFNFLQTAQVGNPVPHSLLTIAALTPREYKIHIINQRQIWLKRHFRGDILVGITCLTSAVTEAYQLSDRFRRCGARVVLGGPHVTALPEEAMEHADSVVVGEAESVWGRVIRDFESGRLERLYKGEPLEDFFAPARDYFLAIDPRVLVNAGIHFDRGCRHHCEFCSRISPWLRFMRWEQIQELIARITGARRSVFSARPVVRFISDNIYSSPAFARDLFKKMVPLKVAWAASSSIDIGFDEEALALARASGCKSLFIGFETIYPQTYRKTTLHQLRSADDYKKAIRNMRARGIKVIGSFILGLDEYRNRDYLKLFWFMARSGLWFIVLTILTPIPGSALFDRLKNEGRIISFDWRKYYFLNCVIKPKHTSVAMVYAWYWIIRLISLFFMPHTLLLMAAYFIAMYSVEHAVRWVLYGY